MLSKATFMRRLILSPLLFILLFSPPAFAKLQSAKLTVNLSPGQWKAMRVKNLPKDAVVKVKIESTGNIAVLFLDEPQYKEYPRVSRPLFESDVRDKISFAVKIPASGHYYVLFKNIMSDGKVDVDVSIHGATGSDSELLLEGATGSDSPIERGEEDLPQEQKVSVGRTLDIIGTELNKLFVFDTFEIRAEMCGRNTAFSSEEGIVLCMEFVKKIQASMGSEKKTTNVLLFVIFHEIGHNLLLQWGYPFHDNEEIADEFATMLMIMLGQTERLNAITEYFVSNPSASEVMALALKDKGHQLSIQRARNLIRWMKEPDRFRRWQTVIVPHMQTAVLKKLDEKPPAWADKDLIRKELLIRKLLDGK
jgi:hypothetical protein